MIKKAIAVAFIYSYILFVLIYKIMQRPFNVQHDSTVVPMWPALMKGGPVNLKFRFSPLLRCWWVDITDNENQGMVTKPPYPVTNPKSIKAASCTVWNGFVVTPFCTRNSFPCHILLVSFLICVCQHGFLSYYLFLPWQPFYATNLALYPFNQNS